MSELRLQADPPTVVICIPTYKRPDQLRSLVEAISRQNVSFSFGVFVGNNDQVHIPDSILRTSDLLFIKELMIKEKGVSIVRNTLIAAALSYEPSSRWIAFIDDDQVPAADWLQKLLATGERFNADMVGGPVQKVPVKPGFWSSAVASHPAPRPEGQVSMLNETGNLLLSTDYLRSLERLPFSPVFGRTGGEDFEFFLYSSRHNAKMYWSPDAHVTEEIPEQRTSFKGLVTRSYCQYAYQARARRLHLGQRRTLLFLAKHFSATPLVFVRILVSSKSLALASGVVVRRVAGAFGSLSGLLGVKPVAYGQ